MECAVCYCNASNCKLVCGHSFCRQCVKDWYQKGSEQTCPMCRHRLYFKGMYKITPVWEQERFEQQRDDAFAEAVDQILEEEDDVADHMEIDEDPMEIDGELEDDESDSEGSVWETASESGSDTEECQCEICQADDEEEYEGWSFNSSDSRLSDIADIQEQFNMFSRIGLDPSVFVQAYAEGAVFEREQAWWEDFPVKKNLFVSKHGVKPVDSPRFGSRLRPMGICV